MFKETVVDRKDEKYLLLFKMGKDWKPVIA